MDTQHELCELTATEQRNLVLAKKISAMELLDAHLAQIEAVNPKVNAIVTLVPEHARTLAARVDQAIAHGEDPGLLAGLPTAHKDLLPTKGIRTTYGSRLHADLIPDENALIVDRMVKAGAVTLGKTNTPEWGAGSQTFNDVFGATRNPYDLSRTCGGSSGGAAVALAARMLPVADGSDMGGSLRNPANFCNVVGFRPSAGRVPALPALDGWATLSVLGPMARTVSDCALLLAAIAGPDDRCPVSLPEPGESFLAELDSDMKGTRIAFSPDFGGQLPVTGEVKSVVAASQSVFAEIGCEVTEGCPDFSGADEVFKTLRAWSFAAKHGEAVHRHPDKYKGTIIWNVESGLKLSGSDVSAAQQLRTQVLQRVVEFMQQVDFLVLPVSQVAPFPITEEYVQNIDGVEMDTYIDWMQSCYFISAVGLPAISVPCGFTEAGLPVGIQIVGRPQADLDVLKMAYAFESATQTWRQSPEIG